MSEKAQPTLGPWRQDTLLVVDAAGNHICHCTRWVGSTPHPEVAEANARLISSAPDLLASVRELHRILLGGMQEDYDEMTAALGRARVAMEKAGVPL